MTSCLPANLARHVEQKPVGYVWVTYGAPRPVIVMELVNYQPYPVSNTYPTNKLSIASVS